MIALLEAGHSRTHINNDARTLVAEDDREETFRVRARTGEFIRVANAAGFDLNQDFASLRAIEIQGHDLRGLPAAYAIAALVFITSGFPDLLLPD